MATEFNRALRGWGSIDTVADSNDLGFMAVRLGTGTLGKRVSPLTLTLSPNGGDGEERGAAVALEPDVYFRVELAGITGHKQRAKDAGIIIKPSEVVAVAAAMIRVFIENVDRSDRKKARLRSLIDRWR